MKRRKFLELGAASGAALILGARTSPVRTAHAGEPTALVPSALDYANLHKFTRPLTRPQRIDMTGGGSIQIDIVQFEQQILDGIYPATTVWGYKIGKGFPSFPGATIVARSNMPVHVHWQNKLPRGYGSFVESHLLPVDTLGHMVEPYKNLPQGNIPIVQHLHGGHTESDSDGGPEQWFTQDFAQKGPDWKKSIYRYDNDQVAATCWYHDHTMGITRLNVYAGLAGMYILRDDNELAMMESNVLPADRHEIELVIQDRDFWNTGQLRLQTTVNPEDGRVPSIFPDFILVNGTPWPVLDVEPRKYRFRILNGSDGRVYRLRLFRQNQGGEEQWPLLQLGTELGFRTHALALDQLLLAPAERYDVVVDFTGLDGQELILKNLGTNGIFRGFNNANNEPHGPLLGASVNPASDGLVMKFRVSKPLSKVPRATVETGTPLGGGLTQLAEAYTRKLVLIQGRDNVIVPPSTQGRIMELQGTLENGTYLYDEPVTEMPALGSVELWEIYNTTFPAHPIHIHLVDFEVVSRQKLTPGFTITRKTHMMPSLGEVTGGTLALADPPLIAGTERGPEPQEQGRKDTVICYPGEVTRVRALFDRPGGYVWHCHILHHEDHDMMRRLFVT